jgi:Subtilase family/Type II secretion system (T2SS), protein G
MEDMRRISAAIKNYSLDFGYAPKAANISDLKKIIEGPYIKSLPQDAWGNELFYQCDEGDPGRFRLASAGSDGKFEGFNQQGRWSAFEGQDLILVSPDPPWQYAPQIEDVSVPGASEDYPTRLNPGTDLGIVRHPSEADFSKLHAGKSELLPKYDPNSEQPWQIDLRSADISALNVMDRIDDLLHASFDSKTRWPQKLPSGYDPAQLMDLGKNPGLGVRKLHQQGITGRGIGIAVIDQGLLVDHVEYKDRLRLYEEIHCGHDQAQMHGPAVASIALGKTVGVAPGADLYYIAETHGVFQPNGFDWDFTHLARSVDRILDVNKQLPAPRKIKVVSISVGWGPWQKGYAEMKAAVERAKNEGIFIVSTSLEATYEGKFKFHGLEKEPLADPERPESYRPASWWLDDFYSGPKYAREPEEMLLVPMDSRSTASPTGPDDYVFYREGGWSWCVPYIAGLYALACQVKPDITPEIFWAKALETGDSVEIPARRPMPSEDEIKNRIQKALEDRLTIIKEQTRGKDMEKAMASVYNRMAGRNIQTMSEAEFRDWTANQVRETIINETKPRSLKTIVNPGRLIQSLSQ